MQAIPSGSARSDALAASSPLHFRQGHYLLAIGPTNSISVNLDDPGSAEGGEDDVAPAPALALATTTSTPALVKFINSISVNLNDQGSAEGGEDDVASTPALSALQTIPLPPGEPPPCKIEGVCPGSRLDDPIAPRQLLLSSAPLAAAAELQAEPRQLLLATASLPAVVELQAAPRQLLLASAPLAAAELRAAPHQHHLLATASLAAAELQASLPIVDNSTGFPPLSISSSARRSSSATATRSSAC
ncbi:hypothetical protein T492DRAFT_919237, partial [Pavlovales sp. CCMP2436]